MDSSNFDNHSKVKHLLYEYYPRFSKICESIEYLRLFPLLLYDGMSNLSQFLSIDKLSKNANISQLGMGISDYCFIE